MRTFQRILVTGATGFVGKRLARALCAERVRVVALGRNFENFDVDGAERVRADLRDADAVRDACRGCDAVIHAGARSSPWGRAADFAAINVGGTENVVAGCRAHGIERLVYVSSPSVVFDGRDQRDLPDDAPFPARFVSIYSATKKRGEDIVHASGPPTTVIVRPKAVFGPGDPSLLPRLIAAARRNRLPQIGDGRNRVDLTYVDNVVDALVLALRAPAATVSGRTYTITNGEHPVLWDVIRAVLRRVGVSDRLRRVPLPIALAGASLLEAVAARTGHEPPLTRYTALILARTQTYDIAAARRDLGYVPRVSVADGLERTLNAL